MARQLWLLRHADAEPHGARQDSERRLTERGERQARLAGEAIALMGVEFEALLSSPKERALRTATIAAQAWSDRSEIGGAQPEGLGQSDRSGIEGTQPGGLGQRYKLELHAPLAGGFDARQALAALADLLPTGDAASGGRLLLVGHEPDLSTVVAELTGARIDLKKGGLAVVRVEGASAELVALLRPSELALIAGRAGRP
jgi:phosphohistidine phosphatase